MMKTRDAIIIGGGPGGTSAAISLAGVDLNVTRVE